jgi:hypothetical protein
LAAVLAAASATAYASADRLGTAGAQELRIPVGARETALGGAVVSEVAGVSALYWNPAGAGNSEATQVLFSHQPYIADMDVEYFAVNAPVGFGTIGASVKVLSVGDMVVTTEEAPEGTGEIASPTMSVIGLTFARAMTDRVLFGVTGMYVNESILRESAKGVAFDFGFQYHPGLQGLKLGLVMKHFGPSMTFDGPDFERLLLPPDQNPFSQRRSFKTQSAAFELPSSFQFGASYERPLGDESRGLVAGTFQSNNFSDDEYRMGAEYAYRETFFARGSFVATGQDSYLFDRGAFGVGFRVRLAGSDMFADYAFVPVSDWFDDIHHFTVRFHF